MAGHTPLFLANVALSVSWFKNHGWIGARREKEVTSKSTIDRRAATESERRVERRGSVVGKSCRLCCPVLRTTGRQTRRTCR